MYQLLEKHNKNIKIPLIFLKINIIVVVDHNQKKVVYIQSINNKNGIIRETLYSILHSISGRGRPLSFHSLAHSNPHEESFSKKAWNPEKYLPTKFPRLFPRHCRALRPTLMAATIPGRQTRAALSLIPRGRRTTGTDSPGDIPSCVLTVY